MKKSALLCICLGFAAGLSACVSEIYETENKCQQVGTFCKPDGNLYACMNGVEMMVSNCQGLGCDSTILACKLGSSSMCSFTGNLCKNGAIHTCQSGIEYRIDDCGGRGCDATTNTCHAAPPATGCSYTGMQCRDGKLYQCNGGVEAMATDCNGLGCDASTNTCRTQTPNPSPDCSYTGNVCKDGKLYQCQSGTETMINDCAGLGCNAQTNRCNTATKPEPACNYKGSQCRDDILYTCNNGVEVPDDCGGLGCDTEYNVCYTYEDMECVKDECSENGRELYKCVDGMIDIVPCIAGCRDGACKAGTCKGTPTTCYDNYHRYVCTDGELSTVKCEDGKACVNNECVSKDAQGTCDFDTACSSDLRGIRKCANGVVSYEACPAAQSCSDETGTPKCVSTVVSGMCTVDFKDYCEDERWLYTCEDPGKTSPDKKDCGRGKCQGNRCVVNSKNFGDDCNPKTFEETCIGNIIAYCHESSKKVSRREDCTQNAGICGIVLENDVSYVACYEPCKVKGSILNSCSIAGDQSWQLQYECVSVDSGIGDGRLGYEYVPGSMLECDIGCSEGKCYDYTEGIPGIGEECDPDKVAGYCKGDMAVSCSAYDGSHILQAEKCYIDEVCIVEDGAYEAPTAICTETCTPGTQKTACGTGIFYNSVFTYDCVEQGGKYYFSSNYSGMTSCNNKTCNAGKCI